MYQFTLTPLAERLVPIQVVDLLRPAVVAEAVFLLPSCYQVFSSDSYLTEKGKKIN